MLFLYPIKSIHEGTLAAPVVITHSSEIAPWLSTEYGEVVPETDHSVKYLSIMCRQNKDVYFHRNPYSSEIHGVLRYIFEPTVEDVRERFYRAREEI